MNLRFHIGALLVVSFFPLQVFAADIDDCKIVRNDFMPGFLLGSQFRERSKTDRVSYMMGFSDGLWSSGAYGTSQDCIEAYAKCMVGVSSEQLTAIVDKYIEANPEYWHLPMTILAFNGIGKFCSVPALAD